MRAPEFWYPREGRAGVTATLLTPLGWIYGSVTQIKLSFSSSQRVGAKVVCIGNLTAGGTGKTPICLAVNDILTSVGTRTSFLTRGYGGSMDDPTQVSPDLHGFEAAGDEALLLAKAAPTYVSPTRVRGALAATRDGADVIIMDDGFQNPALKKDVSIVVIDGPAGLGNRRMIPAGPLRESVKLGLHRADAIFILGPLREGPEKDLLEKSGKPIFQAHINVDPRSEVDRDQPVVAFSGIGRPQKFFDTLRKEGFNLLEAVPYPDHHAFSRKDLSWLETLASERNGALITTSKDFVRLPPDFQARTRELPILALFEAPDELESFLHQKLSGEN
jgi:tetraacyldisaccharide 4'-kinase